MKRSLKKPAMLPPGAYTTQVTAVFDGIAPAPAPRDRDQVMRINYEVLYGVSWTGQKFIGPKRRLVAVVKRA